MKKANGMITKRKVLLLSMALGITSLVSAQTGTTFEVPKNVVLVAKEDYPKYEKDMVAAAKWLQATDLNMEVAKRKQVNGFVIKWITGSPNVNVDINDALFELYNDNAELLTIYLAAYAEDYIEHGSNATKFTATKAALIATMNVYKKGIDIVPDAEMDKLIKQTTKNKLDSYINDVIIPNKS